MYVPSSVHFEKRMVRQLKSIPGTHQFVSKKAHAVLHSSDLQGREMFMLQSTSLPLPRSPFHLPCIPNMLWPCKIWSTTLKTQWEYTTYTYIHSLIALQHYLNAIHFGSTICCIPYALPWGTNGRWAVSRKQWLKAAFSCLWHVVWMASVHVLAYVYNGTCMYYTCKWPRSCFLWSGKAMVCKY